MNAYEPIEIVVTPQTTHILIDHIHDSRRILTDGRDWPKEIEPTFTGYSIGKWVDEDGDGRYDVLVVETRDFKGPRAYDARGTPLHRTTRPSSRSASISTRPIRTSSTTRSPMIDNALTRPWTIDQEISARSQTAPGVARSRLRRGQPARRHRQRELSC